MGANPAIVVIDALYPGGFGPSRPSNFPFPQATNLQSDLGVNISESPVLAGEQMPGQWLLTRAPRKFGWQQIQGPYLSGATLRPIGDPLAEIEYRVNIWTEGDARRYIDLLKGKLKKPVIQISGTGAGGTNASTAAMGIKDAQLNSVGILVVVVASVTPLMNPLASGNPRGPWTATVAFTEYRAPIQAVPTPEQIIPSAAPPSPGAQDNVATSTAQQAQGAQDRWNALAKSFL